MQRRQQMWFMHEDVKHLNTKFHEKWIRRGGPATRSCRLLDLNPLDFYLWAHLKGMMHR